MKNVLGELLERLVNDIISLSKDAGQQASGKTYSMMGWQTEDDGETVSGWVFAPVWFNTLLEGRGPGKIPANFGKIILEWMNRKGISSSSAKDTARMANAIAWKIRREGTQMYRDHRYVDLLDTPSKDFDESLTESLNKWVTDLIDEAFLEQEE